MFAILLALSLVGLALGPVLVAIGRRQVLIFAALDGLMLGLVPVLVALRLLPHLYEEAGPIALPLLGAGYAIFAVTERRSHGNEARLERAVLVPALAVHSLLDGSALALAFAGGDGLAPALLGGALLVHRLPEGLLLATTLTPRIGFRRMLRVVAVIGAATLVGALGGRALLDAAPHAALHGFVALGLGVLLRLVVHRHGPPPERPAARLLSGLGFLLGVAALPPLGTAELRDLAAQHPSTLERAAALIAAALLALSVLRAGPWSWIVARPGGHGGEPHAHAGPAP